MKHIKQRPSLWPVGNYTHSESNNQDNTLPLDLEPCEQQAGMAMPSDFFRSHPAGWRVNHPHCFAVTLTTSWFWPTTVALKESEEILKAYRSILETIGIESPVIKRAKNSPRRDFSFHKSK
ncbi:hypothetical protein O181_026923 [Austropuccinia psidii MF-1]|uniref:Uncharacterized protein n=1 Tax=Austropuccinia psidii MF-1 TaxID=1389203 RepID=A0A9Q3H0G3_9BASI|nr:hypothetical protein [Austropuccinia psidii MF-1]